MSDLDQWVRSLTWWEVSLIVVALCALGLAIVMAVEIARR